MTNHLHSTTCSQDESEPCPYAHDSWVRLTNWTADGSPYHLESGAFSPEARRHYRGYVTDWLRWCDRAGYDPFTLDRLLIGDWIGEEHSARPLATRGAMVSAVRSYYQHLLALGVADGISPDITRAALTGSVVPTDPLRTGLRGDGPRWLMQAADRLTGRDALRDRAVIYLLLNGYFGHEKLRPGAILALDVEDGTNEGHRTTWKIRPKTGDDTGTITVTISRDAARILDTYTGLTRAGTLEPDPAFGRLTNPKYDTYPSRGALLTTTAARARGARMARSDTINRIVRNTIATHEELAPHVNRLSADFIAATPPPGKHPKDQDDKNEG